jgi:hypothetical protein
MMFVKGSGVSISVVRTGKALSMARSVTIRLFMDWIFRRFREIWTKQMVFFEFYSVATIKMFSDLIAIISQHKEDLLPIRFLKGNNNVIKLID